MIEFGTTQIELGCEILELTGRAITSHCMAELNTICEYSVVLREAQPQWPAFILSEWWSVVFTSKIKSLQTSWGEGVGQSVVSYLHDDIPVMGIFVYSATPQSYVHFWLWTRF